MTSADFVTIEILLAQLLVSAKQVFNREELEEVQAFIDAGEQGLSLETFADIVVEEEKKISQDDLHLITRLASLMDMDQEAFSQKLERCLRMVS